MPFGWTTGLTLSQEPAMSTPTKLRLAQSSRHLQCARRDRHSNAAFHEWTQLYRSGQQHSASFIAHEQNTSGTALFCFNEGLFGAFIGAAPDRRLPAGFQQRVRPPSAALGCKPGGSGNRAARIGFRALRLTWSISLLPMYRILRRDNCLPRRGRVHPAGRRAT